MGGAWSSGRSRPRGHSPDRRWWWNGVAWVPAFSPDGTWWWDGGRWEPARTGERTSNRLLILGAWVFTLGVLTFTMLAALVGLHRSAGHAVSGTALMLAPVLMLIGPAVVLLTWWIDDRPPHPVLPRLRRLSAVGLTVGVPAAFVAFQLATFRY